ncbi:MAG: hypothetical protein U1F34_02815 [Gammaproteobacteria bacterium]
MKVPRHFLLTVTRRRMDMYCGKMELANTERIANEGAQVFYHGDIGRRLVDGVKRWWHLD